MPPAKAPAAGMRGPRRRGLLWLALLAGAGWAGPVWAQAAGDAVAAPRVTPQVSSAAVQALIPDAAVADPAGWAKSTGVAPDAGAPGADAAGASQGLGAVAPQVLDSVAPHVLDSVAPHVLDSVAPLNPGSPLPDVAGFTLPWPDAHLDLPALPEVAADGDAADAALAVGREDEIPALLAVPVLPHHSASDHQDRLAAGRVVIGWTGSATGIPERGALEARFRQLSAIENLPGKSLENLGQLGVRATSDRATLDKLMQVYGYYDAEVTQSVSAVAAQSASAGTAQTARAGAAQSVSAGAAQTARAGAAQSIGAGAGDLARAGDARVRFDIVPGDRYRFGAVALPGIDAAGADAAGLRAGYAVRGGDPLYADVVVAQGAGLATALGEYGFPFAKVGAPGLLVDHARQEGDLTQPVVPGGQYRFGAIVSGRPKFLSSDHLRRIARFRSGELWRTCNVEDLRRAILATGIISSVTITPRVVVPAVAPAPATAEQIAAGAALAPAPGAVAAPGAFDAGACAVAPAVKRARRRKAASAGPVAAGAVAPVGTPGEVALDVNMVPGPLHTVSAAVGYDTAEGVRVETSWEDRNLFPPEGSLKLRTVLGTDEQLAGISFRRNNFAGRDRVLTVDLYADNAHLTAYAARTLTLSGNFERLTTLLFQKPWTWSLGTEVVASAEREGVPSGITTGRTNYLTVAAPLRAGWDDSNDFLDPTAGVRFSLRVSPEVSWARGKTSAYVRVEGNGSWYQPVARGVVIALRERLGSIAGAELADIAPSRRFYAGGGGSLRGFGYELVGPRNALGEPEGARSVYELSGEVRFHTGLFGGALSLAPFLDAGGAEVQPMPKFNAWREGAGLGLRYASSFGPIRLDVGTPLDPHPGDSRVGVYVSIGQAF